MRRDYRDAAVQTMVVMGESNAFGMCATDPQNEWVQVLAACIRQHQDGYLRVLNNAIPANVISPTSPGYTAYREPYTTSPSALERYREHLIAHDPDLAVFAYGLNDSRSGHGAESFLHDYDTIVRDVRASLPDALVVLVSPYWNPQYDLDLWAEPRYQKARDEFGVFGRSGDDLVGAYIDGIRDLAERHNCLFVDVYRPLEGAAWLIHEDACHYTDVGQALIGMHVFAALATNCSFLSVKSTAAYEEGGFTVSDTGGTNGHPGPLETWRYRDWATATRKAAT